MKHTELPLRRIGNYLVDAKGQRVLRLSKFPHESLGGVRLKRGDEIVTACNAYGPMVEALKKAENMLRIHSGCNCADCIDDLGEVRTVLAQLPSESEVG